MSEQEYMALDTTAGGAPLMQAADFTLDDYQGNVILLNFWATWCAPCRAEMPDLAELQKELGAEGLQIIGVAMDQKGKKAVAPYVAREPINYPIVIDADGTLAEQYGGVAALPTTLVIGRTGKVQQRIIGRIRADQLRGQLEDALTHGAPIDSSATAHL